MQVISAYARCVQSRRGLDNRQTGAISEGWRAEARGATDICQVSATGVRASCSSCRPQAQLGRCRLTRDRSMRRPPVRESLSEEENFVSPEGRSAPPGPSENGTRLLICRGTLPSDTARLARLQGFHGSSSPAWLARRECRLTRLGRRRGLHASPLSYAPLWLSHFRFGSLRATGTHSAAPGLRLGESIRRLRHRQAALS